MHRVLIVVTVALGLCASFAQAGAAEEKFGAGVTLKDATPIAKLFESPAGFVGKTVRVEGVVSAVCEEMGCWMELKDEQSGRSIQLKVDDGVIVFPVTAKGKKATGEGTFEAIGANDPQAMEAATKDDPQHKAMQAMKYRIKATGAVVY
jgi:hypothetical protein